MEGVDLRGLDLNLLVALEALLRLGNVTAAARALGVTQPAMSRTLQRLRDTLGDPLLVRVGRGVVPTDRARALADPLAEALRSVSRVFAPPDAFDPLTARGTLTLGLGDEAQVAFVDAILTALSARAPNVDLRIRALTATSLDEGRRGVLDLAVGPDLTPLPALAGAVDYDDFVVKHLYTRRFVVVGAARHPRASLGLADYLAARHVIVAFDGGGRGFVDELLAAEGHTRRVAANVTSFPSAVSLVACTDLLATVPAEIVHPAAAARLGVNVYEPPFALPTLPMLCIWHPRRTADPRHQFFRDLVMRAVVDRMRTVALDPSPAR